MSAFVYQYAAGSLVFLLGLEVGRRRGVWNGREPRGRRLLAAYVLGLAGLALLQGTILFLASLTAP